VPALLILSIALSLAVIVGFAKLVHYVWRRGLDSTVEAYERHLAANRSAKRYRVTMIVEELESEAPPSRLPFQQCDDSWQYN
jgi:hypothetical protein